MLQEELEPVKGFHVDLNRACNARCLICYYRFSTWDCPDKNKKEIWQKSLNDVKHEILAGIQRGCKYVNFTGGEPTIHPNIEEIVEFCTSRNLEVVMITNGLLSTSKVNSLIGAGCKHWLLSIHGYEKTQDEILQVPGAWDKMQDVIKTLNKRNVFWRTNCTMCKKNKDQLFDISQYVYEHGTRGINFIGLNLYYDDWQVKKTDDIQCSYKEFVIQLENSVLWLENRNVWVNIRYFPMCFLSRYCRRFVVNHPQVYFDGGKESHEWDYGIMPKTIERYMKTARDMQCGINQQDGECGKCGIRNVCGGINKHYSKLFGDEVKAQNEISDYPWYYRRQYTTDIIIPAYRMKSDIDRLLIEIIHKTQPPYNIHIINQNLPASINRNFGHHSTYGDYTIMCDDDICELPYKWNRKLIEPLITEPSIMAVSARLMNEDGSIGLNTANNRDIESDLVDVSMIPTACCAFRTFDAKDISFDENMKGSGWEDTDFFKELYEECKSEGTVTRIVINNKVKVVHLNEEKEGFSTDNGRYNKTRFETKWLK